MGRSGLFEVDRICPTPGSVLGSPSPDLTIFLTTGARWTLGERKPLRFTMIVFHCGYRCIACEGLLTAIDRRYNDLLLRGVEAVSISMDSFEQAQEAMVRRKLYSLPVGFGLTVGQARAWGLTLSGTRGDAWPFLTEPAIYLVGRDRSIPAAYRKTDMLALPTLDELLALLDAPTDGACDDGAQCRDQRTRSHRGIP